MFAAWYSSTHDPCEVTCERVNIKAFQELIKQGNKHDLLRI
jgi:hypothetical protein